MASDVFQLLGKISVDTTEFTNRINAALTAVNNLATAINGLDGRTVNVNVNANTNNPTNTLTNTQTAAQNTNPTQQEGEGATIAPTVAVTGAGRNGWTIADGVMANLATDAARWLGRQVADFLDAGWERNVTEDQMTAKFAALARIPINEATLLMDELNQYALDTPLDAPDVWTTAMRLLNYGISPEDLIDEMWMLGNMAMGDSTAMGSIAKAYSETLGKNMLYAQESYQFINAGVPIFQLLEDYYASEAYSGGNKGLSASDIKGRLNAQGDNGVTVSAEDIQAAFGMAVSPGGRYHNMMNNMMDTTYGQQQRITENTEVIAANVTDPFVRVAEKHIFPALLDLQEALIEISDRSEVSKIEDAVYGGDPLGAMLSGTPLINGLTDMYSNLPDESDGGFVPSSLLFLQELFGGGSPTESYVRNLLRQEIDDSEDVQIPESKTDSDYESGKRQNEFGGSFADKLFFDDGNYLPATSGLSSLLVELQNMPQQVTAAVKDGISGMTITANVSTGNVTLQDGTLVGALAPRINFILGAMNARSSRG